jgi:molybdopterin converting factor small subunit
MAIKVKLNFPLQKLSGNREIIEVSGSPVRQCLNNLVNQMPESERFIFNPDGSSLLLLLLNNEPLLNQDLEHPVQDDDELWLLSIVSGG